MASCSFDEVLDDFDMDLWLDEVTGGGHFGHRLPPFVTSLNHPKNFNYFTEKKMDSKMEKRTFKVQLLETEPSGDNCWTHDTYIYLKSQIHENKDYKKFGKRYFFSTSSRYVDGFISVGDFVRIVKNMYFGPHESGSVTDGFPCRVPQCILLNVNNES